MIRLVISGSLLDRGESIGVASVCGEGERERVHQELGKPWIGKVIEKISRTGFGVEEFFEDFGVIGVIN